MFSRKLFVVMAAILLSLGACSSASDSETTTGYVSPDGSLTVLDESERVPAPEIQGEDLDGNPIDLSDYIGESIVVINAWGSWCPPCRAEAPELVAADKNNPDIEFFGIVLRDSRDSAQSFVEEFQIQYPNLFDPAGEQLLGFADSLPAVALPTTYVIDEQGRVAARIVDQITESTLLNVIEQVKQGQ